MLTPRLDSQIQLDQAQLLGRVFGGYRIQHKLASGGMATVYLAHKAGPGGFSQPSAIKVIHAHMAQDPEFVDMFLDEARIASCVNHPNVCKVIDFGKTEGTYYLAMEYLKGETWSGTLHSLRAHPEGEAAIPALLANILAQAADGLHAAHEATDHTGAPLQIVHRDVSPQNLLVGYDGGVHILDFGIASAADRLHTTRTGAIKGRFAYMAPEQMRGEGCDRRADVWSLGVVLREGLTGTSLFRRSSDAETVFAVTQQPLPAWDANVPPALRAIANKALQRDPNLRYRTTREMGQDMRRFVMSKPAGAGDPELGAWMQALFAPQMERKRQLLLRSHVLALSAGTSRSVPTPPVSLQPKVAGDTSSVSRVRSLPSEQKTPPEPAEVPRPARLSPTNLAIAVAVVALLGALALVWFDSRLGGVPSALSP